MIPKSSSKNTKKIILIPFSFWYSYIPELFILSCLLLIKTKLTWYKLISSSNISSFFESNYTSISLIIIHYTVSQTWETTSILQTLPPFADSKSFQTQPPSLNPPFISLQQNSLSVLKTQNPFQMIKPLILIAIFVQKTTLILQIPLILEVLRILHTKDVVLSLKTTFMSCR